MTLTLKQKKKRAYKLGLQWEATGNLLVPFKCSELMEMLEPTPGENNIQIVRQFQRGFIAGLTRK